MKILSRDEAIIESYQSGMSLEMISRHLPISIAGAWKILKRNGIKLRPCSHPSGENHPKRKLKDSEEIEICNDYKEGMIGVEIEKKYGINPTLLTKILRRHSFKSRINRETGKVGKYTSRYMGGVYYNEKGYKCLYLPDYKWCHKGGWIQEHRYVTQEHLGRRLLPKEHVHHINGIKDDNRLENLQVMGASEHSKLHNNPTQG